ncbi:SGNH/GDSL hydrolase family protein [Xanthomonas phage JGB6]|nr:SGNH/GDSL hydrolase family protein [Xanthomonas phage JGB6]
MFASLNNYLPNNQQAQTLRGFLSRIGKPVGSGELTHVALRFDAWYINGASPISNLGSVLPIAEASLEYNGVVVPVTFNGARDKTLQPGDFDVVCDEVPASAFGVTTIPRGAVIFIKVKYIFPTTTCRMPYGLVRVGSISGGYSAWFDPAVVTPSSTDALGQWTVTGGSTTGLQSSWTPHLLGRYKSSSAKVWLFVGDSIAMGTGDTTYTRNSGVGWPAITCQDMDGGLPVSFGNIAIHGSTSAYFGFGDKVSSFTKYATHMHVMYGTNDFGTSANGNRTILQNRLASGITTGKVCRTIGSRKPL